MKKDFFNKFNFRFFILIVIIFFSKLTLSFAENVKSINITGNERLSNETILLFSEIDISNDLNVNDLNEAIKKLYQTDYFEDIKMLIDNEVS